MGLQLKRFRNGQVKARLLAEAEEQEARRLTLEATEALLQKVQRKTQLFDAMARALRTETAAVEVGFGSVLSAQTSGISGSKMPSHGLY